MRSGAVDVSRWLLASALILLGAGCGGGDAMEPAAGPVEVAVPAAIELMGNLAQPAAVTNATDALADLGDLAPPDVATAFDAELLPPA